VLDKKPDGGLNVHTETDKDGNEVPVYPTNTDNNQIIPTDGNSNPIVFTDKDGKVIVPKDSDGNPLLALNKLGQLVLDLDKNGKPIIPKDENGNLVLPVDNKGDLIIPQDQNGKKIIPVTPGGIPIVSLDQNGDPLPYNPDNRNDGNSKTNFPINKKFRRQASTDYRPNRQAYNSQGQEWDLHFAPNWSGPRGAQWPDLACGP
jgi:hypothetical protein